MANNLLRRRNAGGGGKVAGRSVEEQRYILLRLGYGLRKKML